MMLRPAGLKPQIYFLLLCTYCIVIHQLQDDKHSSYTLPCLTLSSRTPDRSRRAVVDLRLRPRGHWDRKSYLLHERNHTHWVCRTRTGTSASVNLNYMRIYAARNVTCMCVRVFACWSLLGFSYRNIHWGPVVDSLRAIISINVAYYYISLRNLLCKCLRFFVLNISVIHNLEIIPRRNILYFLAEKGYFIQN
jgi:hypothetical protein